MCKECPGKTPPQHRVAVWCTSCFLPADIELQLCRSCHPATRDLVDKALPGHAEQELKLNDLLYTIPTITGHEPALQQHVFFGCPNNEEGTKNMPEALPTYALNPEPMSSEHCRLCLHDCSTIGPDPKGRPTSEYHEHHDKELRGVSPSVLQHAKEYHGLPDADAYRRAVFTRVQAEWPQPVTAQVMRMSQERMLGLSLEYLFLFNMLGTNAKLECMV